jgi:hypothetical protein
MLEKKVQEWYIIKESSTKVVRQGSEKAQLIPLITPETRAVLRPSGSPGKT